MAKVLVVTEVSFSKTGNEAKARESAAKYPLHTGKKAELKTPGYYRTADSILVAEEHDLEAIYKTMPEAERFRHWADGYKRSGINHPAKERYLTEHGLKAPSAASTAALKAVTAELEKTISMAKGLKMPLKDIITLIAGRLPDALVTEIFNKA